MPTLFTQYTYGFRLVHTINKVGNVRIAQQLLRIRQNFTFNLGNYSGHGNRCNHGK